MTMAEIRKAATADIPAISAIAQSNSLDAMAETVTREEMEDKGFLVSEHTAKDYDRLLRKHPQCFVLTMGGTVVAFLLGQDDRELDLGKMVNRELFIQHDKPFAVIKQIFVAPEHAGHGYGRALYQHFIKQAKRDVFAAVVMDPELENKGSVAFHLKMGFEKAYEIEGEDGLNRWMFRRLWGTVAQ